MKEPMTDIEKVSRAIWTMAGGHEGSFDDMSDAKKKTVAIYAGHAIAALKDTPTVIAHLDGTFCHYQWNVQIPNSGQMPLYAHPDTDELTKAARDLLEWYDAPDCANDAPPYIEALRAALRAKPAKQYFIGPETMRMVFDPNNLTDMSDLQRVLDTVEVALGNHKT